MGIRKIFITGLFLVSTICAFSQEEALTTSGKKVLLHSNGTWEYVESDTPGITEEPVSLDKTDTSAKNQVADAASSEVVRSESSPSPGSSDVPAASIFTPSFIIAVSVAIAVLAFVLIFFLVIQPAKKRRLYSKAFKIITRQEVEQYDTAIQLLETAIIKGLKSSIANEVFFALAYVKLQLNKLDESIAEARKITEMDPDALYLSMYILYRKKSYNEIYELYEKHAEKVDLTGQSKEILSIACIELAKEKCRNQLHEKAIPYFDLVKKLKTNAEHIPENVSNMEVTLGIQALYNKDFERAVEFFTKAKDKAIESKKSTIECDLGLVLCEWMQSDLPNPDDKIADILKQVHNDYKDMQAVEQETKSDEEGSGEITGSVSEKQILTSNLYLLYSISDIYSWFRLPEQEGLPDERIEKIHKRLESAKSYNPDQSDADFMLGLIDYYFNEDVGAEEAINRLEQSGVTLPDIVQLIKKEKERIEKDKKAIERYLELATGYLHNSKIPVELRTELKERLVRYNRFKEATDALDENKDLENESATLQEIQSRSKLTRKHINDILKSRYNKMNQENNEQFSELINDLNEKSELIQNNSKSLEKTEHLLMLNTGEYLFNEENAEVLDNEEEQD